MLEALFIVGIGAWIIVTVLALITLGLMFFGSAVTQVPFVPVPAVVARRVAEWVHLPEGGVFYDLGSGEGRVVRAVSRANPAARAIGVEKAPLPFLLAHLFTSCRTFPTVQYVQKDFRSVPLQDASCVFLYLFPHVMDTLEPKLVRELAPGTSVISCNFIFKNRSPLKSEKIRACGREHTLYRYEF